MNKVKFRAKTWISGAFIYGYYVSDDKSYHAIVSPDPSDEELMINHQCNASTVGQFTGLKDVNNNDIYEGDIVSQHSEWNGGYNDDECGETETIGVVAITGSKGAVLNQAKKVDLLACDDVWEKTWSINVRGSRCKVVGNIHDNPE